MGIFGFRKKGADTVDFTQGYKIPPKKPSFKYSGGMIDLRAQNQANSNSSNNLQESSSSGFDFLNTIASSASDNNLIENKNPVAQVSEMSEMKIKLREMTRKLEDSSNEMYKLLQKIELLERKLERFERS